MTMTNTSGVYLLKPDEIHELLVRPVTALSVAMNPKCSTVVTVSSKELLAPVVTADPAAAWVSEGAEITPQDMTFAELTITPCKVAGLTIVTRELAQDSSPAAQQVVGTALSRDLARVIDTAFLGNVVSPAPPGLGSLPTTAGNVQITAAGATPTTLDAFATAMSKAEAAGSPVTAWVMSATDVLVYSLLKVGTGNNGYLLTEYGSDPTRPVARSILGVPVFVSPQATAGTIWGLPADRLLTVVRDDATVESDSSVYFTSDRVAIKATMRVAFGFLQNSAIQKVTIP